MSMLATYGWSCQTDRSPRSDVELFRLPDERYLPFAGIRSQLSAVHSWSMWTAPDSSARPMSTANQASRTAIPSCCPVTVTAHSRGGEQGGALPVLSAVAARGAGQGQLSPEVQLCHECSVMLFD